ncbi:hypothetical protein [Aureispira sp. CCB-QB1]|uniref:hypothetical protein n=1 Tax=Aureispira sp. CCB-QB1 TaxID=1313421 RepID=UPI000696B1A7|nr:hypothetical protein [Aureispira sp. CCB-QB1]
MKLTLIIILTALFFSCNSGQKNDVEQKPEKTKVEVQNPKKKEFSTENTTEKQTDIFCDTTKFPDYQENLEEIHKELSNTKFQDIKAKEFIDNACSKDSLFCGDINRKISKSYKFDDEWSLTLVGYVLHQITGMEENSASFFVLTINRKEQVWFSDILSDLMGEIEVSLKGFEDKDKQVRVWGEIYPYFEPDYGKFELTIKNGTGFYEYECHAEH